MATDADFVDYIVRQIQKAGTITSKKMFGEYALYADGVVFGFVCDNRLFVKPTTSGRAYIGTPAEAPPYTGAKNYFLVEDQVEDSRWLSGLIRASLPELPLPKPKKKK